MPVDNRAAGARIGAVALATLGCKVNQAESDQFARGFAAAGLRIVDFDQPADAYIINSCTVTHVADRKSRQIIRQARRANPAGLVVATGCYAAVSAAEMRKATPLDLIVPNSEKGRLVEIVLAAVGGRVDGERTHPPPPGNRTRAFIKVQDGCNSLCSFCIIPYARGQERSVPGDEVVAAVRQRLAAGHREILLTGVHVGSYGQDLAPRVSLRRLLETVLEKTGAGRLRLSSIEPWNFDPEMLDLWQCGRLCRHFHLALQSGSDAVLRRMRRPYDVAAFAALLETIRRRIPDVAITTDVIVGFPGESDEEFSESLERVSTLGFAAVHVFPYSPRRRTAASKMPGAVPPTLRRARMEAMLAAAEASGRLFRRRFLGRELDVLYEQRVGQEGGKGHGAEPACWEGLTDNYIRVMAAAPADLSNRIVRTRLLEEAAGTVCGSIVGSPRVFR